MCHVFLVGFCRTWCHRLSRGGLYVVPRDLRESRTPRHCQQTYPPPPVPQVNMTQRDFHATSFMFQALMTRRYASLCDDNFSSRSVWAFGKSMFCCSCFPRRQRTISRGAERCSEGGGTRVTVVGSVPLETTWNKEKQSGSELFQGRFLWTSNSRERWEHCEILNWRQHVFFLPPPSHPLFIRAIDTGEGIKP